MNIYSAEQIREWDAYTIEHEPVSSIDLMERAAIAFTDWLLKTGLAESHREIMIVCGMGNNGGDGLAIARLLHLADFRPKVFMVRHTQKTTSDLETNLARYEAMDTVEWLTELTLKELQITEKCLVIDALLGSGLTRPVHGLMAEVITRINRSNAEVVSVDIASGLFTDQPNQPEDLIIEPTHTVSFQIPKLAFLQPSTAVHVGTWHTVDIGLSKAFKPDTKWFYTDVHAVPELKTRSVFSNKGTFGHGLLLAGSYGKIGAAVLSSKACIRSGIGLLTLYTPRCGYSILQTSVPEAMCLTDENDTELTSFPDLSSYSAVGIGPGLGKADDTKKLFPDFLKACQDIPCVLDADALNIISEQRDLLENLPAQTILTPHPKEFQRLLGKSWKNDYQKLEWLGAFCERYHVTVVLKGQHTVVCTPEQQFHFNSTGNAGMATGGTGDVLTGILTALLAQGMDTKNAAILGVYRHGEAGDRAAAYRGQVSLIAGDLIESLRW